MKNFSYSYFISFLLFVSIVLINTSIYSQELLVKYAVENKEQIKDYKKKLAVMDPSKKRIATVALKARELAGKSTYSLEIDNNLSYFYVNDLLFSDSNGKRVNNLAEIYADKGDFYQDSKTKKVYEDNTGNSKTILLYEFDFFDWELLNEKKEILGYMCFKANVTYKEPHPIEEKDLIREITVWYAPEIPMSFGPQGYGGLPGLILEKCQSGTCLKATEITFKPTHVTIPKKETITREAFYETFKNKSPF